MKRVIQSAINLSTSSPFLVEKIVEEISGLPGLKVADYSSDPDHNRSVVTLIGEEESLEKSRAQNCGDSRKRNRYIQASGRASPSGSGRCDSFYSLAGSGYGGL